MKHTITFEYDEETGEMSFSHNCNSDLDAAAALGTIATIKHKAFAALLDANAVAIMNLIRIVPAFETKETVRAIDDMRLIKKRLRE